MILEATLAYLHLVAVLSWVVFVTSAAVLARDEIVTAAALARLVRVDHINQAAAIATLLTGLARTAWGVKGTAWYWNQPLWWAKLALLLLMLGAGLAASRRIAGWRRAHVADGRLPTPDAIAGVRRQLMWSSHLMVLPPLAGVLLARGIATL
jgi:putative membrane protein